MEKLARYPKIAKTLLKASGHWCGRGRHLPKSSPTFGISATDCRSVPIIIIFFLLLPRLNNSIDHLWQVARPAGFERIMYRQETVPKAPFIDKVEVSVCCVVKPGIPMPTFFQVCRDGVIIHPWRGWVCLLKWVVV